MPANPKIQLATLSEDELKMYRKLDDQSYGEILAQKVVKKLKAPEYEDGGIFHSHRGYCGLGLCYNKGEYLLGIVNDGYMPPWPIIRSFKTEVKFVKWLAKENDREMARYGEKFNNQCITKIRLEWFLADNYSPVWNDYCQYVRERYS